MTGFVTIRVFADGPLKSPLTAIASEFGSQTGFAVEVSTAASPLLRQRILEGEAGDVVVVQPEHVDELARAGKAFGDLRPVITSVGVGLAARKDTHTMAVSSAETLTAAILSADAVLFNELASGNHFAWVLKRLGIAESASFVRTGPTEMFSRVLESSGKVIAVGMLTQICAADGLKLIGPLPDDLQTYIDYTAAMLTSTSQPEVAREFISSLDTAHAKAVFGAFGSC